MQVEDEEEDGSDDEVVSMMPELVMHHVWTEAINAPA